MTNDFIVTRRSSVSRTPARYAGASSVLQVDRSGSLVERHVPKIFIHQDAIPMAHRYPKYVPKEPLITSRRTRDPEPTSIRRRYSASLTRQPFNDVAREPVSSVARQSPYDVARRSSVCLLDNRSGQLVYNVARQPVNGVAMQPVYDVARRSSVCQVEDGARQPVYGVARQPVYSVARRSSISQVDDGARKPVYGVARRSSVCQVDDGARQPVYGVARQPINGVARRSSVCVVKDNAQPPHQRNSVYAKNNFETDASPRSYSSRKYETPRRPNPSEEVRTLRRRTESAKERLFQQKVLLDRYLPLNMSNSSVEDEVKFKYDELVERMPYLEIESRSPESKEKTSRIIEPYEPADLQKLSSVRTFNYSVSNSFTPKMSDTRRRARNVLCKVKGDPNYFNYQL